MRAFARKIPVDAGQARDGERPRAMPAVRPFRRLPVREAGQGRQASAAHFFALLLVLPLAACDADRTAARAVLANRNCTRIDLHVLPRFDRPCDGSELYALGYDATCEGRRVAGTLCGKTEGLGAHRFLRERDVGRAPAWDSFGSVR